MLRVTSGTLRLAAQCVDVRGCFAWSLLDNVEWPYGAGTWFGIIRMDCDTQVRTPKRSARWYAERIATWKVARRRRYR